MRLEELKRIHRAGCAGCERKRRDPLGDHQCPPFPLRMPSQWTSKVRLFEVHDLLLSRPPLPQSSITKSSSNSNFRNSYNEHARSKEITSKNFCRAAVESFFGTLTEFAGSPERMKNSSFLSRGNHGIFREAKCDMAFAHIGVCAPPQSFRCNALKGWKFPGTRGSSL